MLSGLLLHLAQRYVLFYFLTFPFFVVCACIRLAGWRTLPLCLAALINWLTTVLSLVRFRVQV